MRFRIAALIVAAFDAAAWLVIAALLWHTRSDPATRGLDQAAALGVTALFAVTGLPAMLLAWRSRAPRLAFGLAIAFPGAFVLAALAVLILWAR